MKSREKTAVLMVAGEDQSKKTVRALTTLSSLTLSLIGVYAILHTFFA